MNDPLKETAAVYETPEAAAEYGDAEGLREIERSLVEKYFRRDRAVLDLGVGAGRTTRALEGLGFEVVGLDISASLLEIAVRRSETTPLVQGSATDLPIKPGSVRQVLFSFNGLDCLYPQETVLRAMREVHRVLETGGVFVYSAHNIFGRFGRHNQSLKWAAAAIVRQHPAFLRLQFSGADIRRWYWRYSEPFGEMLHFSAPPKVHAALQAQAGFRPTGAFGEPGRRGGAFITLTSHHVHYVATK